MRKVKRVNIIARKTFSWEECDAHTPDGVPIKFQADPRDESLDDTTPPMYLPDNYIWVGVGHVVTDVPIPRWCDARDQSIEGEKERLRRSMKTLVEEQESLRAITHQES